MKLHLNPLSHALVAAMLSPCSTAQAVSTPSPAGAAVPVDAGALPPLTGDLRIPLHTAPDEDGRGAYGIWAAGPGFKASFHDGFCFYPYRGPYRPTSYLHWRTESVRRGGHELAGGTPVVTRTAWRLERRLGAVSEVYDVRADGVEQSFVLHGPPGGAGDVEVVGRITTDLDVPMAPQGIQDLTFVEEGEPVVRYGAALAFDAGGRPVGVTTTCDGDRIVLRLPGSFLAGAHYPVTIDPLTSPATLNTSAAGPIVRTAVAADNSGPSGRAMVVFSRQWSSTDTDAYGLLCDKDFRNPVVVWTDLHTAWGTRELDVCHVDGADRFVVGFQRDFGAADAQIRLYLHGDRTTALNSGTTHTANAPAGKRRQFPRLGGSRGADRFSALLVCEEDLQSERWASAGGTLVRAMVVDVASATVGTAQAVGGTSTGVDRFRPSVSPESDKWSFSFFANDWVIAWGERTTSYAIRVARLGAGGGLVSSHVAHTANEALENPVVAGSWDLPHGGGRFAVCWSQRSSLATSLRVRRVDFRTSTPNWYGPQTIASVSGGGVGSVDVAHDWGTRSHWAVTYTREVPLRAKTAHAVRLGGTGFVVERQVLPVASGEPAGLSVAFSEPAGSQRFMVCYGATDARQGLYGCEFTYGSGAGAVAYGGACNGGNITAHGEPFAGNTAFGVHFLASFGEPVVYALGAAPLDAPLPNGCRLLVHPLVTFGILSGGPTPNPSLPLPLPDNPILIGDVYVQALVLTGPQPRASTGLRIQVR